MNDAQMLSAITEMLSGPPASVMIIMAIGAAAKSHNLNGLYYFRQICIESRFNPEAVNPKSGCIGLGQMNPEFWPQANCEVEANLMLSAGYMRELLERYGNDWQMALAAYNFGPANVNNLIQKYGRDWLEHLPKETWAYVRWIMEGK